MGKEKNSGFKVLAENRKARFDYHIEDTLEAGIELTGSEVKSLRGGSVNLKDSYIAFKGNEAFLRNAHIGPYKSSSIFNHDPERPRKLLLKRGELERLARDLHEKGYTCVPLRIYLKGQWVKLAIALAKGKQAADKRETKRAREVSRQLADVKRKVRD